MPSQNKMESQSAKVLTYLKNMDSGTIFTATEIHNELEQDGVSYGAIAGFLSRLKKESALTIDAMRTGPTGKKFEVYRIVDLSKIQTRNSSSGGSKIGRMVDGHTRKDKLVELLMQVASELDTMVVKSSIQDFTSDELMKEMKRRMSLADVRSIAPTEPKEKE